MNVFFVSIRAYRGLRFNASYAEKLAKKLAKKKARQEKATILMKKIDEAREKEKKAAKVNPFSVSFCDQIVNYKYS